MKRVVIIAAAILMLVSLAACQEREVTGSYGTDVATGRVITTGDLEGSSPAGIDVRVVGTGMVTTLDASGRFSFVGVPESGATLHFTRNDGVDATYQMNGVEREAEIVLSKRQASKSRRRGVGHPGAEIEGIIQTAGETSITVLGGNGTEYVIALTETTVIRHGNQILTWEDLGEGDRVHVKATLGEDGSLTAVEVKLQNGNGNGEGVGHPGVEIEGLIQTASETSITVITGNGTVYDIALTPDTIIRKGNTTLTWEALVENARVHVKATVGEDESLTAVEVKLQKS